MSFLESWCVKAGKLQRRSELAGRRFILDENAELRKQPEALRTLSFGQMALQIPSPDLRALWRKYPDLNAKNAATKRNAWLRFIASSESDPYRVRDRSRKRGASRSTVAADRLAATN